MDLTQEERNIVNCKLNGLRNAEISKKYNFSETEVSIIYHNLLDKYGVTSIVQLREKLNFDGINEG